MLSPRSSSAPLPALTVRLSSPRGFCAGVERAIRTVEETLALHGAPVYVRHEIVHNTHVVNRLSAMGAIFVDELEDVAPDRPVIFSAHGVAQAVHSEAKRRKLDAIDATCPLVLKVHGQIRRHAAAGRHVFLIGHAGHPEVVGAMGQAPEGAVTLVQTAADIARLPDRAGETAYATQTTLSVDDTQEIIAALKARFPRISAPAREDICYATSNRQDAVKAAAKGVDLFVVIGSPTSSNSMRLVETALVAGARDAVLIEDASTFDWSRLPAVETIGLSAGASAPESLVEDFLAALAGTRRLVIETVETARENVVFKIPLLMAG